MTVKFLFVMTNKKARTTEVVIRTNILLSNKSDFLIPQLTTEANISRPFTRPIRFGLRIILMLKQLFCDRLLDSGPLSLLDVPYQIIIFSGI